ncbi:unnamed protein product [Pleuronectes platessa]|uniref:Uncharacterized protein n=1 Tax=Pleuronectes platessa TaxID=8262 RepID=A0A9N7VV63_PLEPL|nr:unnamed protein product [Pleuronectes platessa]
MSVDLPLVGGQECSGCRSETTAGDRQPLFRLQISVIGCVVDSTQPAPSRSLSQGPGNCMLNLPWCDGPVYEGGSRGRVSAAAAAAHVTSLCGSLLRGGRPPSPHIPRPIREQTNWVKGGSRPNRLVPVAQAACSFPGRLLCSRHPEPVQRGAWLRSQRPSTTPSGLMCVCLCRGVARPLPPRSMEQEEFPNLVMQR